MSEELLRGIVTVVGGAVAGGLTNTVAIWMLFHPTRPPAVLGRSIRALQGAIPKNQPRLAKAIGNTVGRRLLTQDDLARVFGEPGFRSAFDQKLDDFLHQLLEVERGSLREILGPEGAAKADRIAGKALDHALPRLREYVASAAFESAVQAKAGALAAFVADASAGDMLTSDRRTRIEDAAAAWMERAVSGDGFRDVVDDYVRQGAGKLLASEATLGEVLPPSVRDALARAMAGYLPAAVQQLGRMLESPASRTRFETTVREMLGRFKDDLKLHQKVMAKLVLKDDMVGRALDALEADGVNRIAELLRERAVQRDTAKWIREALDRPLNQILGDPEDPSLAGSLDTAVEWIVDLARAPATRAFVAERLAAFLERASERTWGELAGGISPQRASALVVEAARSEMADSLCREGAQRLAAFALDRPIGRPARLLPGNTVERIRQAAGDPMWSWMQGQVPKVVAKVDVAKQVEDKVREFPVKDLETLVRRVTERELKMIVWLGYGLGAFVGAFLVGVNWLWG